MNDDMIVCTCMNVTVKDIKDAIAAGADSFAKVQEKTGIASVCGVCIDDAELIVKELLNR